MSFLRRIKIPKDIDEVLLTTSKINEGDLMYCGKEYTHLK